MWAGRPCPAWVGCGQCSPRRRRPHGAAPRRNRGQALRRRPGCPKPAQSHSVGPRGVRGWRSAAGCGRRHQCWHAAWSTARHGCGQAPRQLPGCLPPRLRPVGLAGGTVQQQQPVSGQAWAEHLEDHLPPAAQAPAPPTVIDARLEAQAPGQVTPGRTRSANPKRRLDETAQCPVITLPDEGDLLHHQHQRHPLGVVQACSGHGCATLKASRISKVARPETGSVPDLLARQSGHRS
jgi:hypothetical protein